MSEARYVPAAGWSFLTPFYDSMLRFTMREDAWRGHLVDETLAGGPRSVLDLGCGTGAITIELERRTQDVRLAGADGDPEVLARAREKAGPGSRIEWVESLAQELPFEDGSFDRVVTALVFHHLVPEVKRAALAEARRVLAPGGRFHLAACGKPQGVVQAGAFRVMQLFDGRETTRDHAAGRVPGMVEEAGFEDVRVGRRVRVAWGTLDLLSATQPG